jgi:hypothetical protein
LHLPSGLHSSRIYNEPSSGFNPDLLGPPVALVLAIAALLLCLLFGALLLYRGAIFSLSFFFPHALFSSLFLAILFLLVPDQLCFSKGSSTVEVEALAKYMQVSHLHFMFLQFYF